ncbi:hypothetical protein HW511_00350 [Asaia siamensis]|uniref:HTH cro/C1-type domain-containing protein n=1 Tax=Asaia siamensis TaxID=110479 RepID=A0ABQ1M426_9PROT|nr:hypothetical protein [Asaia siamensis]GBR06353.1 hypothetical protein AA0323_1364 [Asaia siamensis NRIC 0323]GGC34356.1 hypothetical protein GCM10007207_19880 [Asaia siamensis]
MKLGDYLKTNQISPRDFGLSIGIKHKATVYRYLNGLRFPSAAALDRIKSATQGKVTADDFVATYRERHGEQLVLETSA